MDSNQLGILFSMQLQSCVAQQNFLLNQSFSTSLHSSKSAISGESSKLKYCSRVFIFLMCLTRFIYDQSCSIIKFSVICKILHMPRCLDLCFFSFPLECLYETSRALTSHKKLIHSYILKWKLWRIFGLINFI